MDEPIQPKRIRIQGEECAWREGDSGLGLPNVEPAGLRRLSVEEADACWREHEAELREKLERHLAGMEAGTLGAFRVPAALRAWLGRALLLAATLLALLLVTQVIEVWADVRALPSAARWVATVGLSVVGAVVLYFIGRLLWGYTRLQRQRQINLKALDALAERRQMQALAVERSQAARQAFETYLRDWRLDKLSPGALRGIGLEPADQEALRRERERLLREGRALGDREWLETFQVRFQSVQDRAAEERVRAYMYRAGLGTLTSPNTLLDQFIVLYSCTAMIGDLMRLYNIRPAWGQSGVILAQSVLQAYLSGLLEGATETAADSMSDTLHHWLGSTGAGVLGGGVARVLGAKVAEGSLNGLLVRRLGRQTIRLLQPMR